MTSTNDTYLPLNTINIPQDNDAYLVFDVVDNDENLVDITGSSEVIFAAFTQKGGVAEIVKKLSLSEITIFGSGYKFGFWINASEASALTNRLSYHECQITNSIGKKRTVSAGVFRAEKTYIKDI